MKKLYIFDLDGTITPPKSPVQEDSALAFCRLLAETKVAIISGSMLSIIETRLLNRLPCEKKVFKNLYLLPTNGAVFYEYNNGEPTLIYQELLTADEKAKVLNAFAEGMKEIGMTVPEKLYGEQIEDRGSQITFSALGQEAPLEEKEKWDPDQVQRKRLREALLPKLPEFEIAIGGATSVDVTKKGIDKAFGIEKLLSHLGLSVWDAEYVGDALFPGGNDSAVLKTGITAVPVRSPAETRELILRILTGEVA